MKKISIYIAGSVKKDAADSNSLFASDDTKDDLSWALNGFQVIIFDPNEAKITGESESFRFAQDCLQVISSNFLVIDLREKRGLGVGAEMMLAKERQIPVIAVCPPNSHYQRSIVFHTGVKNEGWVHPFVESLSDVIVEDFTKAGEWIKEFIENPRKIKSGEIIDESIKCYMDNTLKKDPDFKKKYEDSLINRLEIKLTK
jgi:hypothetical protein